MCGAGHPTGQRYRRLLQLRRREPSLASGSLKGVAAHFSEQARWSVVDRGPISVACNLAGQPREVPPRTQTHQVLLTSAPLPDIVYTRVTLPPDSTVVLQLAEI
jgi:maltooligosyltrehalose trehalohydrolase